MGRWLQPMLASLLHVPASLGYGFLFLLVGMESAGAPLPGETALLTAAVLAAQGRLSLPLVIVVAFELLTLAWIRSRFFRTRFLNSFASVTLGGAIIAGISAGLGGLAG